MTLNCICKPVQEEFDAAKELGCKTTELQLTDFVSRNLEFSTDIPIKAIYPRVEEGNVAGGTLSNVSILREDRYDELCHIYNLIRCIKEQTGSTPALVLRMTGLSSLEAGIGVTRRIDEMKNTYRISPRILFENSIICKADGTFDNGFYKEPLKLVNVCNQISQSAQYGTCLNVRYAKCASSIVSRVGVSKITMEDYVRAYQTTCRILKINNVSCVGCYEHDCQQLVSKRELKDLAIHLDTYQVRADVSADIEHYKKIVDTGTGHLISAL